MLLLDNIPEILLEIKFMTNLLNFDSNQNYINDPKICDINLNLNDCDIDIKNDNYSSIIPDNYLNIIYNAQKPFLISKENSILYLYLVLILFIHFNFIINQKIFCSNQYYFFIFRFYLIYILNRKKFYR